MNTIGFSFCRPPTVRKFGSRAVSRSSLPLNACLAAFLVLPLAVGAVSPAPDGSYANGNTAEGTNALNSLTTGGNNTALGFQALFNNSSGSANTATGADAVLHNTTGNDNTALGFEALLNNTVSNNTAIGFSALANNTTGNDNTATGSNALFHNTTGFANTAEGQAALFSHRPIHLISVMPSIPNLVCQSLDSFLKSFRRSAIPS